MEDEILFPYETRFSKTEQAIILKHARKLSEEIPNAENYFHLQQFLKRIEAIENPASKENI